MTERPKKIGGFTGKGFKPGQSGNPGGRSKALIDVIETARTHTPLAMKTLASIAEDEKAPQSARVAAANGLLDRGWGKPTQPNQTLGADGEAIDPPKVEFILKIEK